MRAPTRGKEILYLCRGDVERCELHDTEMLELVRVALQEHGSKRTEMPAKIGLHPVQDSIMHAMPAWVPGAHSCGMKWAAAFPDNHLLGLAQTSGLLVLNDEESGWPLAVMDAAWITARRTPAVSALACEFLAKTSTSVLAIIGCGVQGAGHLDFLPLKLPNITEVRLFDSRPQIAAALAGRARTNGNNFAIHVINDVKDAVVGADVVVTVTAILREPKPIVRHDWIGEGMLILPVDFDSAWEWETLSGADKFIVDDVSEMEYFRTIGYLANGLPPVHAEIGEIVAEQRTGRENDDELIVDMNIGMGVEDVVVARTLFDRAVEAEIGTLLPT